jgi:hypothetical protein
VLQPRANQFGNGATVFAAVITLQQLIAAAAIAVRAHVVMDAFSHR